MFVGHAALERGSAESGTATFNKTHQKRAVPQKKENVEDTGHRA